MTKCSSYYLLCIAFATLLSLSTTTGETHIVGEDEGWTQIPNYADWTSGKRFHVGDTLVFSYSPDLHNVVQVNETAYDECIKEPNLGMLQSGNDSVTMAEVGHIWYICGVGDHCENGQKLSITIFP